MLRMEVTPLGPSWLKHFQVYPHKEVRSLRFVNKGWYTYTGRDPFNQNFRKFRSKTQWIGSVQPEKFRKTGPPFEVVLFSRSDRLEFWLNGSRPQWQTPEGGVWKLWEFIPFGDVTIRKWFWLDDCQNIRVIVRTFSRPGIWYSADRMLAWSQCEFQFF